MLPNCPKCKSEYTYEDGSLLICPECGHEWTAASQTAEEEASIIRDANGNVLNDGDYICILFHVPNLWPLCFFRKTSN